MPENNLPKMVGWYDPAQLLDTAGKTVISTIVGENAAPPLPNASLTHQPIFDYSTELPAHGHGLRSTEDPRQEIWLDYVADAGDGWNSTATIARCVASGIMPKGFEGRARGGDILILGGDEIYPTAGRRGYEERLVEPYRRAAAAAGLTPAAYREGDPVDLREYPHIFAIPGNHDWYDSLFAFRYLFCAPYFNERVFANGWRTRQRRSYFALKLPFDWWVFGLDFQLTHNLDWAQQEYFDHVVRNTRDEKNVRLVPG